MDAIYRKEFIIDPIFTDRYLRLKPSSLLYFAQEAAADHCLLLEADWDTLNKKHLFWAVIRHKVQITRLPVQGEHITVETWPMPTTRVAYPRATAGYDSSGNELFRCISLWVLMDTESRSMVLPEKSGVEVIGALRGNELSVPKNLLPRSFRNHTFRDVTFSLLDRNGHMNNTRYLDWVDDLLPSAFHQLHFPREFTVCYLSEAREGQQLCLDWELSEGGILSVNAHREKTDAPGETERVFSVQSVF